MVPALIGVWELVTLAIGVVEDGFKVTCPLELTWNLSPSPTVKSAAGEESPIPTLASKIFTSSVAWSSNSILPAEAPSPNQSSSAVESANAAPVVIDPTAVISPVPEAAISIEPLPLVIVTPDPAVRVALVKVLPVVFPINNCPSV